MKILLLSPYHAKSHQYWCEALMSQFSTDDWTLLSLPARNFSWRIRGNAFSFAFREKEQLLKEYDMLIATSMTDLSSLFGFVPSLTSIPNILYFHENQFAYPLSTNARDNIEPLIVPLYAAICADRLCFNSQYNYDSFISGAAALLKKMPDFVPPNIIRQLEIKSQILPVPIADQCFDQQNNSISVDQNELTKPLRSTNFSIVWNHRWEYDKWPECFFLALRKLKAENVVFTLHILGEQFKNAPAIFDDAKREFENEIADWGRVENHVEYRAILKSAHLVVSTALHDFQGIAVLEAVALGCIPVVPDRLAYPEWFTNAYCYSSCVDDIDRQATILAEHLMMRYCQWQSKRSIHVEPPTALSWQILRGEYQTLFNDLRSTTSTVII